MTSSKLSFRYAKSLLDLAIEQNNLEVVKNDIESFLKMLENRDLVLLLKSPIVNTLKKESIFKALFGERFSVLTNAFFNIVLKKGRESNLEDIAKNFIVQYKQLIGLTSVKLTTATPIDAANLQAIKTKLIASKETAKDVEITTAVNPAIIGGYVLQIGDNLYDNSISHKLNQLKKNISNKEFIKSI